VSLGSASYLPNFRVVRDEHVTTVVIDNLAVKNACTDDAERRAPNFFGHQDCDG